MAAFTFFKPGALPKDDQQLQPEEQLAAGDYFFRREDALLEPCTPQSGPRGKYRHRAPTFSSADSTSTISGSKRSSVCQSAFFFNVAVRDSLCLLTGSSPEDCTAAHILPIFRPEASPPPYAQDTEEEIQADPDAAPRPLYYTESPGDGSRYQCRPSSGLLLRDDLHHALDRFEFALWPLVSPASPVYPH
ncbi:hypothetical protein OC842_005971 [Tilletia horrida]|uniref:HNH nuclease domain-containing protein n=1 Tax=Tilletia horrida TaxID=155126 RepID=A0AAN6G927_9BASI|nr:hypothetical protein OC842_005971 [Tilletia horrida]